jgi:hypothetical protein
MAWFDLKETQCPFCERFTANLERMRLHNDEAEFRAR